MDNSNSHRQLPTKGYYYSSLFVLYSTADGSLVGAGVLSLVDQEAAVILFLTSHGKRLLDERPLPKELLTRFKEKFPVSKDYF